MLTAGRLLGIFSLSLSPCISLKINKLKNKTKQRLRETFSVQKGVYKKREDRTGGQEELHWDCEV